MFEAAVLAGGVKTDLLAREENVDNKVLVDINGRPMLSYVLKALQEAPSVGRIAVVGPGEGLQELHREGLEFTVVPERTGLLDNLAACFSAVNRNRLCLVAGGDIPLLNVKALEGFIESCAPHDCDFYYPLLRRETCVEKYPETERTYVRLREGFLTGGNICLIKPAWFLEHREQLELFISYRKKPVKLLRIMPPAFILKYLLKKLAVADLENHLSRLLELRARAVFCDHAEIGVDVDKPSDLALVRKAL